MISGSRVALLNSSAWVYIADVWRIHMRRLLALLTCIEGASCLRILKLAAPRTEKSFISAPSECTFRGHYLRPSGHTIDP